MQRALWRRNPQKCGVRRCADSHDDTGNPGRYHYCNADEWPNCARTGSRCHAFDHNPEVVGTIYFAYILACVVMYVLYIIFIRHFIKILSTPMNYMFPVILLMCLIGALTANNRIFDIWVFCVMGVLGYIFNRVGIPLAPLTLGMCWVQRWS